MYDGQQQVDVYWNKPAGATSDNWKGVVEYLEDPDLSAQPAAPMDGTVKLDGSAQLSGTWSPTLEKQTSDSPASIILDGQAVQRDIRIYLASYGNAKNAVLVRANKAGATPNIKITLPATAGKYVRGQEYALLIKNPAITVIDDFDNPAGPQYHMNFFYDEPDPIPLPPGMDDFGGVQTVYEYPLSDGSFGNGQRIQAKFLDAKKPDTWVSDSYPAVTGIFRVWFASADINQRVNTIVPGVTPYVDVHIVYPPDGTLTSPTVTDLAISDPLWEWQPDGTIFAEANLTWTPPDSARFSGVEFWRTDKLPPVKLGDAGNLLTQFTLQVIDWPKTPEDWTITAIAYDYNGKLSDDPNAPSQYSPSVIWHIGPPVLGDAPDVDVSGVTISFEQEHSSDGVVRMRTTVKGWVNPPDNQFGGVSIVRIYNNEYDDEAIWDAALADTSFTSDWEPAPSARSWEFYFVPRDQQGHRNALLQGWPAPGTTPMVTSDVFTPMPGDIVPSRMPTGWWDPTEFQWPAYPDGEFQALQFVAQKIFVGSVLRVGGGTGTDAASFAGQQNGQIAVYNSQNVLRAWMGQHDATGTPDNPTLHSIYGGWFGELYVGGGDPPTAPFYCTNAGVVIVGGIAAGNPYPYISIRDDRNTEVGRIGALIGGPPGVDANTPLVPTTDPAYISGAWFYEFALGGQSLADWRLLAAKDQTVKLRNINLFTIAWPANYNDTTKPSNPFNAATTLTFGLDAYNASAGSYKFPGITLTHTGATQGINLIDRGLIIIGPSARVASLVAFNGDSSGANGGQFWSELTMYSPTSQAINVQLTSGNDGSVSFRHPGSAYFYLTDQSGNKIIECTQRSDGFGGYIPVVNIGSELHNYQRMLIDGSGNFVGTGVQVSGNIQTGTSFNGPTGQTWIDSNGNHSGTSYKVGATTVISTVGAFVGAGVNCPNNGIAGAGFNPFVGGTQWNGVPSASFTTADGHTVTVRGGVIVQFV